MDVTNSPCQAPLKGSFSGREPCAIIGPVQFPGSTSPHQKSLRDHVLETQWNGEEPTVGRIDAYFLKNREESGERGYRLALRRRDNETLRALIDGKDVSEIDDSSELILDGYTYFRELLGGPGVDPAQIYEGVHRLVVVDVKLQLAVDNPQLIFESLNSTGIDLTQSDLIRNYLLMGLPLISADQLSRQAPTPT